jgi:hypothetical protein
MQAAEPRTNPTAPLLAVGRVPPPGHSLGIHRTRSIQCRTWKLLTVSVTVWFSLAEWFSLLFVPFVLFSFVFFFLFVCFATSSSYHLPTLGMNTIPFLFDIEHATGFTPASFVKQA